MRKIERRFRASNTIYYVYKNYRARQFKSNMRQAATVQQPQQQQPLRVAMLQCLLNFIKASAKNPMPYLDAVQTLMQNVKYVQR